MSGSLFYFGLNPRWDMHRFLPRGLNIMFSAAGFWNGYGWRKKKFPRWAGRTFLDCGGFTMLNQYSDYPFSVVNLANLIARLRPDFYVPMDFPCEPEISRSLGLMSNRARIEATVQNAVALAGYEDELPGQLVPVIQGYTLDEYEYCIELHRCAGTIREYMAVGSMCRRISTGKLDSLIPGIYCAARRAGCEKLHFFGLKLSPDLKPLSRYIWSRDSAVAMDSYHPGLRVTRGGRRYPRGQAEKQAVLKAFLGRLKALDLQYANER